MMCRLHTGRYLEFVPYHGPRIHQHLIHDYIQSHNYHIVDKEMGIITKLLVLAVAVLAGLFFTGVLFPKSEAPKPEDGWWGRGPKQPEADTSIREFKVFSFSKANYCGCTIICRVTYTSSFIVTYIRHPSLVAFAMIYLHDV